MINPRYAREIPQRYRLEAVRCNSCKKVFFPPRSKCNACGSDEFSMMNLSEEGKIVTYTIIRVASEKYSHQTPYAVAIVELNDGARLTAQICDAELDQIKIGKQVRLVFRKVNEDGKSGIICYGYKAVLV
jgi:uncharacterized OB-fold protein